MIGPPPTPINDGKATGIYAIHDPTEVSQRFYVGMTTNPKKRLEAHLYPGILKKPTIRACWLRSLLSRVVHPELVVLEVVPPGADYQDAERFWIASLRGLGAQLVNGTDGGHGARGLVFTDESRAKISRAHKGRKMPREGVERGAAKRRGRVATEAQRARISAAGLGRKWTDEQRRLTKQARHEQPQRRDSRMPFKGVKWNPTPYSVSWSARIAKKHIGSFPTAVEAALAYDSAARGLWGTDAALNFPRDGERGAGASGIIPEDLPLPSKVSHNKTRALLRRRRKEAGICIHCTKPARTGRCTCERH